MSALGQVLLRQAQHTSSGSGRVLHCLASVCQQLLGQTTANAATNNSSSSSSSSPASSNSSHHRIASSLRPANGIGWPQSCSHRPHSSASISPSEQQGSTTAVYAAADPAVEAAKELTRVIRAATEPWQLLQLIQQHGAGLSPIHVSAVFICARRMREADENALQNPDMQQLQQQLPALAEGVRQQCGARELGNIMGASVRLQLPGVATALLPSLLQQDMLQRADAQSVAHALYGLANSAARPTGEQVQQLFLAPLSKPDADSRDIGLAVQAMFVLQHPLSTEQLRSCVEKVLQTLQTAHARCIHTVLAAVHGLGMQLPAGQLQHLVGRLLQQLSGADAGAISHVLLACAKCEWQPPPHELGCLLARSSCTTSNTTQKLVWAVSTFDQQAMLAHVRHLQPVLDHMLELLPDASSLAICDTLYLASWLQLHTPQRQVQQAVEKLVSDQQLPDCNHFVVSSVLRSVAGLGYRVSQDQLDALMRRLLEVLPNAKPKHLRAVLRAVGAMGLRLPAEHWQQLVARLEELESEEGH